MASGSNERHYRFRELAAASPIGRIKPGATETIRRHFVELERMHHRRVA
jgi:hypothetical protein